MLEVGRSLKYEVASLDRRIYMLYKMQEEL